MEFSKKIFIMLPFVLFFSCKQIDEDKKNFVLKQDKIESIELKIGLKNLDKSQFVESEWVEIEKIDNSFKNSKVKDEWLSFVNILNENKVKIVLMEPVEYELDSIQATENQIILHIKGADWTYEFYWVDENQKIGRWDYVYDKKIDSSFSMYAINKKYKHLLD